MFRSTGRVLLTLFVFVFAFVTQAVAQTTAAQKQTFTVCPLNVDGLPAKILGVSVNPDGPGSDGTKKIGNYIATKGIDILGFSEDFTYNDELTSGLGSDYTTSTFRGSLTAGNMKGLKFDTDGLLYAVKNNHKLSNERIVSWNKTYGYIKNGADENIDKGYRSAIVTLSSGLQVEVYILHMDAETDAEDNEARASQWTQLAQAIINNGNANLPKIVMGDTNSRYTRDDIKGLFYSPLESAGYTVNDVWVDFCQNGVAPTLGADALMVGDDKLNPDNYRTGEIVDKVFYINSANATSKLVANSITFDAANYVKEDKQELLGDHVPILVEMTIEGSGYTPAQTGFWEGETFTDGASDQNYYLYNVGSQYFLTYHNEEGPTVKDIRKANLWQLNHSEHEDPNWLGLGGNKHGGQYYCTSIFYKHSDNNEYRVKCAIRTGQSSWFAKVAQDNSGATNFYIQNKDAVTSGAYCLESYEYLGAQYRLFGVTSSDGSVIYDAKKTYTDNTTDWLFISEAQKQAYLKYDDLYTFLSQNVNTREELTEEIQTVLEETQNTTYSTSADAISKLQAMKEKYEKLDVTVTSAHYATVCLPWNAKVPEGVTIYLADQFLESTSSATNYLHLKEFEGDVLPYGVGVLVYSATPATYTFTRTEEEGSVITSNLLAGTIRTISADQVGYDDYNIYTLANKKSGVGFYPTKNTVNMPRYRAYYRIAKSSLQSEDSAAKGVTFSLGETTGVRSVAAAESKIEAVYGVAGEKRAGLQRGVNIVKMSDGTFRKVFKK